MRNTLLLAAALLPLAATAQKTTKVVVKQSNPWSQETYYVLQDNKNVKHGPYLQQSNSLRAQPIQQGFYKQGQRDSTWIEYGWNGQRQGTGAYRNDQKTGTWSYYAAGDTLEQRYNHSTRTLEFTRIRPADQQKQYTVVEGAGSRQVSLDRPPLYIGGQQAMNQAVGTSVRYPALALRNRAGGDVVIEFLVDEQGRASGHRVKSGVGYGCDEEALRAVQQLPAGWLPGVLAGQPIAALMEVPVKFRIR
ncbi:energy transducer TonB [Hymenobacter canadensis]|uniref:Energy transducer TonB n=1 Tax=Hymenobacter canadensis TaxID=2999067 RepID=A0ABY7LW08_9BACT|nr:energy transducer TonB [Hymenobacter canadensis]WBA43103.1 energy transducer TonB [Hymenobacter canadensis]